MSSADSEWILEGRGIGRHVDDVWLLSGVSLRLAAGERVGLIGASGSGKSLLLRTLCLLDPIDTGEVLYRGQPIPDADVPGFRSRVLLLQQRPALPPETVDAALRSPLELWVHRDRTWDRERVVKWLAACGRPAEFLSRETGNLSGGERQLVCLLRALQLDPEVLLLDEPTASMDVTTAQRVESLVAEWIDNGSDRSVIWVTHDTAQAQRVADRILRMEGGRMT